MTQAGSDALSPPSVGVGFKAEHFDAILDSRPKLGFFEVHAENYMGAGGPPHRRLEAIRALYPLSLHGVGLSIGSPAPLDRAHLARLASVAERYQPALVSEHLAWSTHEGAFFNDLLPLPYTEETLDAGLRARRRRAIGASAHDPRREPLDLCRLRRDDDGRDGVSVPRSSGGPAAASCSTSTTSSSARPITASIPIAIWPAFRSPPSARSTSPATRTTATTPACRC